MMGDGMSTALFKPGLEPVRYLGAETPYTALCAVREEAHSYSYHAAEPDFDLGSCCALVARIQSPDNGNWANAFERCFSGHEGRGIEALEAYARWDTGEWRSTNVCLVLVMEFNRRMTMRELRAMLDFRFGEAFFQTFNGMDAISDWVYKRSSVLGDMPKMVFEPGVSAVRKGITRYRNVVGKDAKEEFLHHGIW